MKGYNVQRKEQIKFFTNTKFFAVFFIGVLLSIGESERKIIKKIKKITSYKIHTPYTEKVRRFPKL